MTTRKYVRELLDMLHVQALLEQRMKAPAFSHVLGLNYAQLSDRQFLPTKKGHSLSFEYTVPKQLRLPYVDSKTKILRAQDDDSSPDAVSLATLLAIMDDVTSWSALTGDLKRKRFGVSINLRAEWAKPVEGSPEGLIRPGQTIHINTKNTKIGKTIGFTHAEVCDPSSGEIIAFGSHVKFLDMGMLNVLLSPMGWPLTKGFLTTMIPYDDEIEQQHQQKYQLPHLFESLDLQKSKPTFTPEKIHSSLGGALHGGCQAVLHELVGSCTAQEILETPRVVLKALQVDYLSTPAENTDVEFDVQVLYPSNHTDKNDNRQAVCIRTAIVSRGRISSQADLRFVAAPE